MNDAVAVSLPEDASKTPDTKWGSIVTGGLNGYQLVPNVLVRHQKHLNINCTDMVVLLNILMHWWETDRESMPHPRPAQIARRIGATTRTVQRSIQNLTSKGLLVWMPSERRKGGLTVRRFDLSGLRQRLQELTKVSEFDEKAA